MTHWSDARTAADVARGVNAEAPVTGPAVFERGKASIHRLRSLQSHIGSLLPLGITLVLGCGLLGWYYSRVARGQQRPAVTHVTAGSTADVPLPALGRIDPPALPPAPAASGSEPPPLPATVPMPLVAAVAEPLSPVLAPGSAAVLAPAPAQGQSGVGKSQAEVALERRLSGPAFARQEGPPAAGTQPAAVVSGVESPGTVPPMAGVGTSAGAATAPAGGLSELLVPTPIAAARARELPTQRLLLAKGTFIDCTLETAIDSSLPGMTTCITATDTFGADGKVVLLERGSKLVGETRGQVQQGSSRLFVLWTEARTPTGVVVPLASPGTDELGRSGVGGEVDRHFWQRFGAAILISMIDGGLQVAAGGGSGTVIYGASSARDVATEALRGSVGIAPTLVKPQGDRLQVLVARDLDFRSVYELRGSAP